MKIMEIFYKKSLTAGELLSKAVFKALDSVTDGVLIYNEEGSLCYVNENGARILGFPAAQVMLNSDTRTHFDGQVFTNEDGDVLDTDSLPASRAMRGEEVSPAVFGARDKSTGVTKWYWTRSMLLSDEDGKRLTVTVFEDITETRRNAKNEKFLLEASRVLTTSLDYAVTLKTVGDLVVPQIADWFGVQLEHNGQLETVAASHTDVSILKRVMEHSKIYRRKNRDSGAYRVFETGEAELIAEITSEALDAAAVDEYERALLVELGFKSYICVPLQVPGRTIGVLTLIQSHSGRRFNEHDLPFIQDLAFRFAHAIHNATLFRDLEIAKKEALQAANAKSEFLSNMSHEIRTPLNSIIGMTDVLRESRDEEEREKCIGIISKAGTSLLGIVNDVLEFSRLEAGQVKLEQHNIELVDFLQKILDIVRHPAQFKGLRLKLEVDKNLPQFIQGDPKRLEQIFLNLLSNAVKFTHAGSVVLSAEAGEAGLVLQVKDTGIGIPSDKLNNVFARFSQADTSVTKRFGGTGLGLAIVKDLVDLMGGRVDVESEFGKGSKFIVTIPLLEGKQPARRIQTQPTVRPSQLSKLTQMSPRILLVEDAPDNRFLIMSFLREFKNNIEISENGAEAVEAFKKKAYDVILMDMQMPVLDGYSATREIRSIEARERRSRTPIVALTAYALSEEVEKSFNAGCDAHLSKPIRKQELTDTIERVLS